MGSTGSFDLNTKYNVQSTKNSDEPLLITATKHCDCD